jgi:hypothetical protein
MLFGSMPYRRHTLLIVISSLAASIVLGNPATVFARNASAHSRPLVELPALPKQLTATDIAPKPPRRRPIPKRQLMSIRGLRRRAAERPPRHRIAAR